MTDLANQKAYNRLSVKNYAKIFTLGCILGALIFILIYGIRVLNPSYDDWIYDCWDIPQHYFGWIFYRNSEWLFPIGNINGLCTQPISIIYTDCIPLFAIFFKILSPILPSTFQYFGIWGIFCFALQGGISALLIRKFTGSIPICLISSVFFILSPVVLRKLYLHSSFAGHWVILLIFLIWLYRKNFTKTWQLAAIWSSLGVIALLVTIYFDVFVFVSLIGFLLLDYLENKKVFRVIIVFVSALSSALLIMYLIGGFSGDFSSTGGGLGYHSANINSIFNSMSDFIDISFNPGNKGATSIFFNGFAIYCRGQYEGFSYMGAGAILAAFVSLVTLILYFFSHGIKETIRKTCRYKKQLISFGTVMLILLVLALSPVITLNDKLLYTIPYPDKIFNLLSIFRTSGRFMWMIMYALELFAIGLIIRLNKTKAVAVILSLCMCVQILDLSDMTRSLNNVYSTEVTHVSVLKDPIWNNLAKTCDEIVFLAIPENYLGFSRLYYDFAEYAVQNNMQLSSFYLARDNYQYISTVAAAEEAAIHSGNARKTCIYVFIDEKLAIMEAPNLTVQRIDGYLVGLAAP